MKKLYFVNSNSKSGEIFETTDLTPGMLKHGGADIRILKSLTTGKVKEVQEKTFKRYYSEVPAPQNLDKQEAPKAEKKAKAPKAKKEPKVIDMTIPNSLEGKIREVTKAMGGEVFEMNVKGTNSLKFKGNMFAAYSVSKNGIIIWTRSKALGESFKNSLGLEIKNMNHMFDRRIKFAGNSAKEMEELGIILKLSKKWQEEKQNAKETEKAAKAKAKADREAAKAAKQEAEKAKGAKAPKARTAEEIVEVRENAKKVEKKG